MATICPTITALNIADYRQQMEAVQDFAERLHIDFMDGELAPTKSISIANAWWEKGPKVDLHVMFKRPLEQLETLISLQPHMIIIHAEAEGMKDFLNEAKGLGIALGLALLKDTPTEAVVPFLGHIDHVLIFSGKLGAFGGTVDLGLLDKVKELKQLKVELEIGWDGGINDKNVLQLAQAGVDVLNVGGFIQTSDNPEAACDTLIEALAKKG